MGANILGLWSLKEMSFVLGVTGIHTLSSVKPVQARIQSISLVQTIYPGTSLDKWTQESWAVP